jgi:hypothetical protein
LPAATLACTLLCTAGALADEPRGEAPDPTRGERYDGRPQKVEGSDVGLALPRAILFPLRMTVLALEPPAKFTVETEQRHHLYQHFHDALTSRDGLIGLRPEAQYTLDFRPSFGARFFNDRAMGYETSLDIVAMGGPDVAHGEIYGRPTPFSWPVQLTFGTVYDRRNDRLFAGVDNTVPVQYGQLGPSRFESDNLDLNLGLGFRVAEPLVLAVGGAFGWRHYGNGEGLAGDPPIEDVYCQRRPDGSCIPGTVDERLVPGFHEGTRYLRVGGGLTLDLRDSAIHSTFGFLLSAGADYSHGIGSGDESSYYRLYGAATLPFNLWAHRHVLLLRLGTQTVTAVGNAIIPFDQLVTLGGPNDLRGFRDQLLRGHSLLLATFEYRFPVWMWMDAAIFVDYGGVFGQWYSGFGAARMQPDLGMALRLFSRDRFWLRVQFAYGWGEGWRFTIATTNWP